VTIGYADKRKGIDLFVEMAQIIVLDNPDVYFIWVGHFDVNLEDGIKRKVADSGLSERVIFPGLDFDSDVYYAAADVYALTSREDPFPCVVQEALGVATPVVAFEGAGGFNELLSRAGGLLVPSFDVAAFAETVEGLLFNDDENLRLGEAGRLLMEKEFSFRHYLYSLLEWVDKPLKKVSVIVPNYNYARHMHRRLQSIAEQDYPVYELIVLDDKSTDDSIEVIKGILATLPIDSQLVVNEYNTGSPFIQWQKGVELACGDYIWIAEADDLTEKTFMSELLQHFDRQSVAMSYCESHQIDEDDIVLAPNYADYLSDISSHKWKQNYLTSGVREICSALSVKNTVPNVSAVIFKRQSIENAFRDYGEIISSYRFAGDWMMYVALMADDSELAFVSNPLNKHRRHTSSVTQQSYGEAHLREVIGVQDYILDNFDVSEEESEKVMSYRQKLAVQFNVAL
jgi:glycosyltransferase involved in cell wall biosynthesis